MSNALKRKPVIIWLVTAALSLPAGWLASRPLTPPASDLVWATIAVGPPWVVWRLLGNLHSPGPPGPRGALSWPGQDAVGRAGRSRDGVWENAFFFGYLPPIVGFEALWGIRQDFSHAVALVALLPLLAYAILWFTRAIIFGGLGVAWLAREVSDPNWKASSVPQRFWRLLRARLSTALRWYAWWLAGAGVGCALALATRQLVQVTSLLPTSTAVGFLAKVLAGLAGGAMTWAVLRLSTPLAMREAAE